MRVRFAPSPTGALHLGSALVALANAAFARSSDGVLILRIDDTDRARSTEAHELDLIRLLRWLDIEWHEGPLRQSDRVELHAAALDQLVDQGDAYPCFCSAARLAELRERQLRDGEPPRYDGRCRRLDAREVARSIAAGAPHVLRFAVPEGRDVVVDDLIRGRVVVPAGSFGDPVLRREDGSPGYLLSSVVDDGELQVTHIIRGEDHLANTARQQLLFESLGVEQLPAFAHLPLLRDAAGRKLSKRDPLGTLDELVEDGFLPVTIRRYLAELLGQGAVDLLHGEPVFDLAAIGTGAPKVDRVRLESIGRSDMATLPVDELLEGTGMAASAGREPVVRELAATSATRVELRAALRLLFDGPAVGDLSEVLEGVAPDASARTAFERALELATVGMRDVIDGAEAAEGAAWAATFVAGYRSSGTELGMRTRELLQPLRVALTGMRSGPGLDLVLAAIGPAEALRRLHLTRMVLEGMPDGGEAGDLG